MANISFTHGKWKKENLEFHTALKRKYISDILKQLLGHFLQHSNSEIKWVSKRINGLLFSGGNVQWILSHFQMCKGQTGTCPVLCACCRRVRLLARAHRCGTLWKLLCTVHSAGKSKPLVFLHTGFCTKGFSGSWAEPALWMVWTLIIILKTLLPELNLNC